MFNFKTSIRNGDRFFRAHCTRLDLFGLVSSGIRADALRLSYMPDLLKPQRGPLFVKSVDDAAAYFTGLLKAEVSPERLAALREFFSACPDEFTPDEITTPSDRFVGRNAFELAIDYATGGRSYREVADADDDFAAAVWQTFAETFFTETVEA